MRTKLSGGGNSVADLQDKIAFDPQAQGDRGGPSADAGRYRGLTQLSLTDPDSRSMHSGTRVGAGYNVQIAIDSKHIPGIGRAAGPQQWYRTSACWR